MAAVPHNGSGASRGFVTRAERLLGQAATYKLVVDMAIQLDALIEDVAALKAQLGSKVEPGPNDLGAI